MSLAAFAAAALIALQPGDAPGSSLTREEARTLPVDILARRLLGAAGELVREVMRPPPQPHPDETGLRQLIFASAPRWARVAGLCTADIFLLRFEPAAEPVGNAEPPVRVAGLGVTTGFRVVGDLESGGDLRTEAEQREYEPLCARAGPVLRTEGRGSSFFRGTREGAPFNPNDAAFAARTFRAAIANADAIVPIQCSDDRSRGLPSICIDPRRTLAGLSPDAPYWFEIVRCEAADALCVVASLPRNIDALADQRYIRVTIRTGQRATYPRPTQIAIRSVTLQAGTIIY